MIHFYYGADRPQTAERLTEAIRSDLGAGKQVFLLVPEQHTVATERRMLAALPMAAQLRFEVVNFSRLANRVFRILGGHSFRPATPAVQALVMWQSLRELAPLLVRYGKHAEEQRLCELMLQTAARCHAYRISAEDLLSVAEQLPSNEPLAGKLKDLGTVIGTFETSLRTLFDNGDEELDRLCELVRERGDTLFGKSCFYVDSFTDFTAQELEVLRALMGCVEDISFTFPLTHAGERGIHLASPVATHRRLLRMANELGLCVSYTNADTDAPKTAREYLSRYLFDMTAKPAPFALMKNPDVEFLRCADPYEQAEAAVAVIHRLVREGCRYRDIAVVLRDATASVGILDAAMERDGIPFFLAEKTDITLRPLVKLILLCLRIRLYGWRSEDVIAYLKTGLCGLSADEVNLLEEYTRVWSPRGEAEFSHPFTKNPDGYTVERSERGERILAMANRARERFVPPLLTLFAALDRAENAEGMCRALYEFLCTLQVAEQMKELAKARLLSGERREAEELSRLYTVTVQAIEELCAALGKQPLSIAQFSQALRLIFSRTDIGIIPTSCDEVTVGSAPMLRTDHPRHVLVLGLNEGEFPRALSDDGLISDAEMAHLAEYGLEFPSGLAERASDELFYLFRAFRAPSESLTLFWTDCAADGRACTPSIAVERAMTLLPLVHATVFGTLEKECTIFTPQAALDRLCELDPGTRDLLSGAFYYTPESESVTFPGQEELQISVLDGSPLKSPVDLSTPVVDTKASISQDTAARLFADASLSPSRLESYSRCHFSYFCEKILKLRTEKKGALSLGDLGNFLHYVLEGVMLAVKREGKAFSAWSEAERNELIARICEKYRADLAANGAPLSPRTSSLMARLTTLAELVVSNLFEEFSDSSFVPVLTEFDLKNLHAPVPAGANATYKNDFGDITRYALYMEKNPCDEDKTPPLAGKADRLDLWNAPSGESFLRVVDYKTGTREFSPEDIKNGYSLQMPLYLQALCRRAYPHLNRTLRLPPNTKLRPAGVTYFSTAISSENTPSRKDSASALQAAQKRLARSGVLLGDPAVLAAASHSANAAIVGTTKAKRHLSAAEIEQMFTDLEHTVRSLTDEMKAGKADASPNLYAGNDPCKYCDYATVCRAATQREKGDED